MERHAEQIVFLIDDVETHLHPRWQKHILPAFSRLIRTIYPETKVQIIAVTHSPTVLASVAPAFDPEQDALFRFDLVGKEVKVKKADGWPRSDAQGGSTSEVFGLE